MKFRILIFLFFFLLFLLNRYLEFAGVYIPWIAGYFDDMIVLPLCFSAFHLIYILFYKYPVTHGLPVSWIIGTAIFFSVYFEVFIPLFDHRFTADGMDIIMYFSGTLVYLFFMNRMKIHPH